MQRRREARSGGDRAGKLLLGKVEVEAGAACEISQCVTLAGAAGGVSSMAFTGQVDEAGSGAESASGVKS